MADGTGRDERDEPAEVAVVGLGGMGSGMAGRLLSEGFPLVVHNRTTARAAPLAAAGARVVTAVHEVAGARVVLLSLSDQAAVEEVLFGRLAGHLRPGSTVVDTSAVSPGYAVESRERLAAQGIRRVEACVVGNPPMAAAGRLRIYTAGDEADAAEVADVLAALGQDVVHVGPTGSASALKLAFNLMLGNQVAALAEALRFVGHAGIDRDVFLTALTGSGFSSATLAFRAQLVRERRYAPAQFRTGLMLKDLTLVLDSVAAHGEQLPVTASAAARFAAAVDAGHADQDASVVADG